MEEGNSSPEGNRSPETRMSKVAMTGAVVAGLVTWGISRLLSGTEPEKNKKMMRAPGQDAVIYREDFQRDHTAGYSKSLPNDIHWLDDPFVALYGSLQQTDEESKKQTQFLALLENHVHKKWPAASLQVYGSSANSFALRNSDMDVCILMDGPCYVQHYVDKPDVLRELAAILRSKNFHVLPITSARVPVLKCMDPVTGISCDICVNNVSAIINTKLIGHYAQIDSRLRQLAFIVKHWAKSRGINKTNHGTLSSYAYVLMCIHFLQSRTPAILPCLQEGMTSTFKQNVDDTECAYFDRVEEFRGFGSRNRESIDQLVWEFFSYWAYDHDYANHVISVRTGRLLRKFEKDWHLRTGVDHHLVCIEDPFEVSHDLGKSVDEPRLGVLKREFKRAAETMQYDPNPCVKLFEPRHEFARFG